MNTLPEALRLADGLDDLGGILSRRGIHPGGVTEAAKELRRLHQHEQALNEWLDKTEWIQDTACCTELGMHRADVMRKRIEQADAREKYLSEQLEQKDKEIDRLNKVIDKLVAQEGSESLISALIRRTKG